MFLKGDEDENDGLFSSEDNRARNCSFSNSSLRRRFVTESDSWSDNAVAAPSEVQQTIKINLLQVA